MSGEPKQEQSFVAALKRQRQEQVFVAEVGREPSPDAVDDEGMTDLHHAARLNLPVLALSLLKQGAAVEARSNNGQTPLHSASSDAPETAEVLRRYGGF